MDKIGDLKTEMYDKENSIMELQTTIAFKDKEIMSFNEKMSEKIKLVEQKF